MLVTMFSLFKKRSKQEESETGPGQPGAFSTAATATDEPPLAASASEAAQPETQPETQSGLNVDALLEASPAAPAVAFGPVDADRTDVLKPAVVDAISTVFDPEIPVNIYELGLIYEIRADAESRVHVRMTLTSPACPSAQQLPSEVRYKIKALQGVSDCTVDIVWEPPWTKDMMSEAAKLSLGMF
jgi:FeS assembly SUF system protein